MISGAGVVSALFFCTDAIDGNAEIISGAGRMLLRAQQTACCWCGEPKNKFYYDGSHIKIDFTAY